MKEEEYRSQHERANEEVSCPIGGCDYQGRPASVEAHISSSTQGDHSGSTGRQYRDQIGASEDLSDDETNEVDVEALQEEAAEVMPDPEETDSPGRALVIGTILLVVMAVLLATQGSRSHQGKQKTNSSSKSGSPTPQASGGGII